MSIINDFTKPLFVKLILIFQNFFIRVASLNYFEILESCAAKVTNTVHNIIFLVQLRKCCSLIRTELANGVSTIFTVELVHALTGISVAKIALWLILAFQLPFIENIRQHPLIVEMHLENL